VIGGSSALLDNAIHSASDVIASALLKEAGVEVILAKD